MAKDYFGEHSLRALVQLIKNTFAEKADKSKVTEVETAVASKLAASDIIDNVTSTDTDKPLSAAQGKILDEKITTQAQTLDTKITDLSDTVDAFDVDNDGVVDKAAFADAAGDANTFDGHAVEYFAKASDIPDVDSMKGAANGIAPLNASGQVDSQYLPSYVDDVIEGVLKNAGTETEKFVTYSGETGSEVEQDVTPEKGKIYVATDTNTSYRWTGTKFVKIVSDDLVELDETEVQSIWDSITVSN